MIPEERKHVKDRVKTGGNHWPVQRRGSALKAGQADVVRSQQTRAKKD